MKRLYFVRHGESEANAKKLFAGRWDVPLTLKGRAQANQAGQDAKNLDIDIVVSSPLKRARQTAEIIAAEIGYPKDKIVYSNLFVERDYGGLQGKPWGEIDDLDFDNIAGIETSTSVQKRAEKGADFLKKLSEDNVLLVGHGTNGRAVFRALTQQQGAIELSSDNEIPNARPIRWI